MVSCVSVFNRIASSVISAKITVTKFSHARYDTEFLVQCNIDLRGDNLQWWVPFANTVDAFRSLKLTDWFGEGSVQILMTCIELAKDVLIQQKKQLTEMRFRKIMWASGTPFCMSNSIAWHAELPWTNTISLSVEWHIMNFRFKTIPIISKISLPSNTTWWPLQKRTVHFCRFLSVANKMNRSTSMPIHQFQE